MNRKRRKQIKLKMRRERIRREKHEQRSRPAYLPQGPPDPSGGPDIWEVGPDEPLERMPSPYASERALLDLHEAMEGRDFSGVDEMNAYLNTLTEDGLEQALGDKPRSPKRQAQELAYEAMEAESRSRRVGLAREALAIDSDCVDALATLAHTTATSQRDLIDQLGAAVAAGERSLGRDFFEEHHGAFWGIIETRPYMRARFALARELLEAGFVEEAIGHMETMLELNPQDNQGVRDSLLPEYFLVEDLEGARRLLDRFENDASAIHMWGRVLERYLSGDIDGASTALKQAREWNPYVQRYLAGRRPLPRTIPEYYSPGQEDEAIVCADDLCAAWQHHPAAIEWLEAEDPTHRTTVIH